LRNRFFFIILSTLVFSAIGINLVHVKFFKSQRLKLIDKQIMESSTALLESSEFKNSVNNVDTIEDTISAVLKGARIGKIFVLRNPKAEIVYQSFNVGLLQTDIPIQNEWVAVETENEYVRVRNIALSDASPFILQVGLVLDRNFLNWEIIDSRVIGYVSGIVAVLFLASVLLTLILLSPLRLLVTHLQESTAHLIYRRDIHQLPNRLLKYTAGFWAKSDEFSDLLSTIRKLIDRINLNHKMTKSWTLQMAHELKTPLALMKVDTETKKKENLLPTQYANDAIEEIGKVSEIITQFLDWAEVENSPLQNDIHALRLNLVIKEIATRLDKIGHGRIQLDLNSDLTVFANPTHLDQLISNLVTNALKFSSEDKKIILILGNDYLIVKDFGTGIPKEVRDRLGEPFNVGSSKNKKGNGLGLAWVVTISKLYEWNLAIRTDTEGTEIEIRFPKEEIS
tara:strand:- start:13521 stop:14879 length:1359 start_codon:yes stop_codon:yes gene_type:complete